MNIKESKSHIYAAENLPELHLTDDEFIHDFFSNVSKRIKPNDVRSASFSITSPCDDNLTPATICTINSFCDQLPADVDMKWDVSIVSSVSGMTANIIIGY